MNIRHQDKELQGDKIRKLNIKMRRGGQDENIRNQDEELEVDKDKNIRNQDEKFRGG